MSHKDAEALIETWLYWREMYAETWREDHKAKVTKARAAIVEAMTNLCGRGSWNFRANGGQRSFCSSACLMAGEHVNAP